MSNSLFKSYEFGATERAKLDRDGHFVFPGLLTATACERLVSSLRNIIAQGKEATKGHEPQRFSAEYDAYLESLIAHPDMQHMARAILGDEIRWDHCVSLVRPKGTPAMAWHSHEYAEDDKSLGFIRIFFYIFGFGHDDGGLKVIPGSHLFRDDSIRARDDAEMGAGWMRGRIHPQTGEPLGIEHLDAPPGSVIVMWTHAAHGVVARQADSTTRYCVVYAYRNPGRPSQARWISEAYESRGVPGAEGLLSLY